jgi:hypothetical protein
MATTLGPYEYVVGSDRVDFLLTYVDENDQPIDITDAMEVKVQGRSTDLPGEPLDIAGVTQDEANGVALFEAFGDAVTDVMLGDLPSATYTLRGMLKDSAGKVTYTQPFTVKWVHQPL